MEGNEAIDRLMMPVLDAIKRHIKDKEAITDIYNRAYEAVMESMDAKEEARVTNLELRLTDLTGAIEDYLNDAREKPAWEKLEEAMNKLGMRR